jgi:hypothetical protein
MWNYQYFNMAKLQHDDDWWLHACMREYTIQASHKTEVQCVADATVTVPTNKAVSILIP